MAKKLKDGQKPRGYVVYLCEHLRDGVEEGAKCVDTIEQALEVINRDRFARSNYTFRLFELGREIPLDTRTVSEPQPAREKTVFVIKED